MDLREFRDTLLRLDHPEQVLELADKYLSMFEEMGSNFVLPREHILVKPALDYYVGDLAGWVKFVKGVRDRLPMDGRQYHSGVQEFFRKLEVRLTQQERRERLDAALTKAISKRIIPDDYDSKVRYARRCTQSWKLRRDNMLKSASASTKTGRLSVAERETLLAEFWSNVDAEIANGELPKP